MILYSMLVCSRLFSIYGFIFILAVNFLLYFIQFATKSKTFIWLSVVLIMWFCNTNDFERFMYEQAKKMRQDAFIEFMSTVYFMILRSISFCVDKTDSESKINNKKSSFNYGLIDFISYTLYPTFLFVSMFVPYKNFIDCVRFFLELFTLLNSKVG